MATSFGALCTDFYINQKLALKMDLPAERETILHMLDRVRADHPRMDRFRRFSDELVLESGRQDGKQSWLELSAQNLRTGVLNPESLDEAYGLHRMILEVCPFHLTISPLDVDHLELMYGFDLECKANHNKVIQEALFAGTPMAELLEMPGGRVVDLQPMFGLALGKACQVHAFFEVKTRTSQAEIRRGRFRPEPISIYLTVRRGGPLGRVEELLTWFDEIRVQAEQLATEKVVPQLLNPISRAIIGTT